MKFADLHLHTIFSDSTYTPGQLIEAASGQGLSAIAVVDHDTVDGIEPALETAEVKKNIEVLPGIELSAEYDGLEIHILGYLIDYQREELKEKLSSLRQNRVERVYKITEKLKNSGIELNPQVVFDLAGGGTVGRLHIARAMVKEGFISSITEAFQKYIGDKSPAYVCGFRFTPQEAIKLIKKFGGVPVLAHPYSMNRDDLIAEFIREGIMGLEVYYPQHSQGEVNFYLGLAKKFNLLVTGGSDCHGNAKPEVKIGSVKIPYALVEKLKAAQKNLC